VVSASRHRRPVPGVSQLHGRVMDLCLS
jgi:hypothetical protein